VRRLVALTVAAAIAGLTFTGPLASAANPPRTRVIAAYLYFHRAKGRLAKVELGTAELVFRLSHRLHTLQDGQLNAGSDIGHQAAVLYPINHGQRCYGSAAVVERDGTISSGLGGKVRIPALPGDHVLVRIGDNHLWLSRRFVVQPQRRGYHWGRALGCRVAHRLPPQG
jgi:hypothetical protein